MMTRLRAACLAAFALIITSAAAAAAAEEIKTLSDAECRIHGFDPWQLACSTCDLLASYVAASNNNNAISICRQCCQAYKDTPRIEKPYEAAVLLYSKSVGRMAAGGADDELAQFLKQDWDELIAAKNKGGGSDKSTAAKATRLLKKERNDNTRPDADGFDIYRMMMLARPQAQLYFFKEPLPTKSSTLAALLGNEESLQERASEVIHLDNSWKRDDIKDMLTTLLP